LAFVTGAKAVGEHARQRLMTYRNEWFLDTNAGMTWLDEIMAEKYNPALTEALVKAELINTDGVKDMVSFSVRFDRATRHLKIVDVQTTTDYEEVVQI
jgi:hypothetical protein